MLLWLSSTTLHKTTFGKIVHQCSIAYYERQRGQALLQQHQTKCEKTQSKRVSTVPSVKMIPAADSRKNEGL